MRMLEESQDKRRAFEENRLVSVTAASPPGRRTGSEPLQRLHEMRRAASNFSHRDDGAEPATRHRAKSAIQPRGAATPQSRVLTILPLTNTYPVICAVNVNRPHKSLRPKASPLHDPDELGCGWVWTIDSTASLRKRRPGSMRTVMKENPGDTWTDQDGLTGRRAPWCAREEARYDCSLPVSGRPRSGDGPFARGAHYPP